MVCILKVYLLLCYDYYMVITHRKDCIILNINDISEVLLLVNNELQKGKSISKTERDLGLGKDTLRKKLNREGYFYVREKKQFIERNTKGITRNKSTDRIISNKGVKKKAISMEEKGNKTLNASEIAEVKELLKVKNELLEMVKVKNSSNNKEGISLMEEVISFDKANRKKATFNLDLELLEKLKEYEKCSNISKSDIVNIAIKKLFNKLRNS
ncbi:MAG: hypothetical protein KID00_14585 [Clostridium argentinense]|nr:hypothetical protein [Clostridium argentinense]